MSLSATWEIPRGEGKAIGDISCGSVKGKGNLKSSTSHAL